MAGLSANASADAGHGSPSSASEAFESLFTAEHGHQVRRAFLMLGSGSLAEEVVADAFAAVWARWDRIDSPGPYLNRCVLNGVRDAIRLQKRASTEVAVDDVPCPAESVVLAQVLTTLPFTQRAALVLRFYGNMSERDIAEALGCRPGTVGSAIHRGLAALRKELR